jgi:hypothetical protein
MPRITKPCHGTTPWPLMLLVRGGASGKHEENRMKCSSCRGTGMCSACGGSGKDVMNNPCARCYPKAGAGKCKQCKGTGEK